MGTNDTNYIPAFSTNMFTQMQANFSKIMSSIAQNCTSFQASSNYNFTPSFIPMTCNYGFNTELYTTPTVYYSSGQTSFESTNNKFTKSYFQNYAGLSKAEAYSLASTDTRLEDLTSGGKRWSISNSNFINDIPFATKGTGEVLDKVASLVGQELVITSALGTKNSPHNKKMGHYSVENTKLDIRGDEKLAQKLKATGYFSHVLFEGDHIDVQISESAYKRFESVA